MSKSITKKSSKSSNAKKSSKSNGAIVAGRYLPAKEAAALKATAKKSSKKPVVIKATKFERVTVLGFSATSLFKAVGKKDADCDLARARKIAEKFASSPLADSTIATALSDGRNPKYNGNAAKLSKDDWKKIAAVK
jgi:hypothetical protein